MGPDHSQLEIYEESKHGVLFQAQHKLHSNFFQNATVAAGGEPYKNANPLLMTQLVTPRLAAVKTEADVIQLAYDLERLASASYQANVGTFDDLTFNQKIMSVGAIEARLSQPDGYADDAALVDDGREHQRLQEEIAYLYREWERHAAEAS